MPQRYQSVRSRPHQRGTYATGTHRRQDVQIVYEGRRPAPHGNESHRTIGCGCYQCNILRKDLLLLPVRLQVSLHLVPQVVRGQNSGIRIPPARYLYQSNCCPVLLIGGSDVKLWA
jgi:hypothetical protein